MAAPVAAPTFNAPVAAPTFDAPVARPSLRPVTPYVATDDDPLKDVDDFNDGGTMGWGWNDSTIDEMEHDRTVIIALSVVFGVMFFFAIFVAYSMLENPDGCCARLVLFFSTIRVPKNILLKFLTLLNSFFLIS